MKLICMVLLLVLVSLSGCGISPQPTTPLHTIRIVLAGDSTVNAGSGWGPGFAKCLAGEAQCINLALNGRSSKSFITEGQWKKCLDAKPDYVLIQFGHNDQPGKGSERETDPQTTYKQYLSQYIDESRAIGAKPILVTSLSRRAWGDDNTIHDTLGPWADAVKELGKAKNVPVIDLHTLSIVFYEKQGKAAINELSARNADGSVDNTHINDKGADEIGKMVAEELKRSVPELAPYIR